MAISWLSMVVMKVPGIEWMPKNHEMVLYDFLARQYSSELARAKEHKNVGSRKERGIGGGN